MNAIGTVSKFRLKDFVLDLGKTNGMNTIIYI
jgi:hypothetical protein